MLLGNFSIALAGEYDLEAECQQSTCHHDYTDAAPDLPKTSTFNASAVTYIAGYAVKMATAKLKCDYCLEALLSRKDEPSLKCQALINHKCHGKQVDASDDVCEQAEILVTKVLSSNNNLAPRDPEGLLPTSAISTVKTCFTKKKRWLFVSLDQHLTDLPAPQNHVYRLVKLLAACYIKIHLHKAAKDMSSHFVQDCVRNSHQILSILKTYS